MVEQDMDLIMIFNFIILIGLVAILRWWHRNRSKLTEKRFALTLSGYWTYFFITTFSPLYKVNFQLTLIVLFVILSAFWGIGYPFDRWLYRKFTSSK